MSVTLNPYLMFDGKCREAMEFYKSIFGGELTMQTFGEAGAPVSDAAKDQMMHADLQSDSLRLMASDGGTGTGTTDPISIGNNISISLSGEDEDKLTNYFNGLTKDGKTDQPLVKAPWGDTFGMLTDKFGIHWMVNITAPKK